MLLLAGTTVASANSAEPPRLIIIVSQPPEDLTISLRFEDETGTLVATFPLDKTQKAWEVRYAFYGSSIMFADVTQSPYKTATLVVSFDGVIQEYPVEDLLMGGRYNNVLSLDIGKEVITDGQTFARSASLVSMRVVLTLLIEGLIFFLFGFRQRRSWITFFIVNIITQGALNIALNMSYLDSTAEVWFRGLNTIPQILLVFIFYNLALIFYEILIFIAEIVVFTIFVKEHKKSRTICFVLLANLCSLIIGGVLITLLPV